MRDFTSVTLPFKGRPQAAPLERAVHEHLGQLLDSAHFDGSARSREFLCYVVKETLAGRGAALNQVAIAVTVFGRKGDDFDAVLDPIVRVQAGRLRRSLERYYLLSSDAGSVRIELPKGSYTPVFVKLDPREAAPVTVLRHLTLAEVTRDRPTVLIHPFAVSSADDLETAARMKDEMASELCRYGDVHVVRRDDMDRADVAQRPAVRFELRGTLRREADDCLVGARLVDRTTGEQVWSDEYHTSVRAGRWSGTLEDVGRIIAARVGSEQGVIARVLVGEPAARRPDTASGGDPIVRCHQFFFSRHLDDVTPVMEAVRQLTVREPQSAQAWAYLARLCLANHSFELSPLHTPVDKAITYAHQALLLDPAGTRVRCIIAAALLVKGEVRAALDELEQTARLSSDSLAYREIIGWLMALAGEWQRGVALMHEAMERNPYCLPHVRHGLWADCLRRGEFERAYVAALEYRDPTFFWRELMLACCLGHLGRLEEAQLNATELLRLKPRFLQRGRTLIGYYIKSEELHERVVAGLHKAGLPV